MPRLKERIFDKGESGFGGFRYAEFALRCNPPAITQYLMEFFNFPLVMTGNH